MGGKERGYGVGFAVVRRSLDIVVHDAIDTCIGLDAMDLHEVFCCYR